MKRFKTLLAGVAIVAGAQLAAGSANAASVICPAIKSCSFDDDSGSAYATVSKGSVKAPTTAVALFKVVLQSAGTFSISVTPGKEGVTLTNLMFNGSTIAKPDYGKLYDFVVTKAGTYDVGFTASNTNNKSVSNSASYSFAAVPEPAAWGLMIGGFGMAGGSLRRRRSARVAIA